METLVTVWPTVTATPEAKHFTGLRLAIRLSVMLNSTSGKFRHPRKLLLAAAVSVMFLAQCRGPQPSPESNRPNIVFIFSDDHSQRAISAYGSRINRTPQIDRLASDGMRFEHCLVTNSICAPSRAVILTGKYSHLNGQLTNAEEFDGSQETFPKLLQQAGYQTAIIGKWHLKSDPTGFDHWQVLIGQGPYYNPPFKTPEGRVQIEGYTTEIVTDLALQWLQEGREADRPFLLMLQHKAPHRRWEPGPSELGLFDDVEVPEPETFRDDYSNRSRAAREANMRVTRHLNALDLKIEPPRDLTPEQMALWNAAYEPKNAALRESGLKGEALDRWKFQRYIKDYLRSIAAVDKSVGRVLDFLDSSGLGEDTLVVYSSDQGWYLGEHGWYDKRWMYEESLHTPLLVRWPGAIEPGRQNSDLVSNLDFAATFLDLAGAAIPETFQGRSLQPLLRGQTPEDWRKSFYYQYYEYPASHCVQRHYGVRTSRYKLIYFYVIDEWELFDLETDPNELESVYGKSDYASIQAELEAELLKLREQYAVPEDDRPVGDCDWDAVGWPGFEE